MRARLPVIAFGCSVVLACGATFEQLQTRAALDLECPAGAIRARDRQPHPAGFRVR